MINRLRKADGSFVDVPLESNRFLHSDTEKAYPTLRFQQLNGWVLLELLGPIILYFRPYCIVEIGAGASTLYLARMAEHAGVKLYTCDKSPRKKVEYFSGHKFYQLFS